jgi:hypothetical protein
MKVLEQRRLFAFAIAALSQLQLAFASTRLHETTLNLEKLLLTSVNPVDPDGKHGPKHIAGYFDLNRTKVWLCTCAALTRSWSVVPGWHQPMGAHAGRRDVLLLL